jgi:trimethylamine--corrinoid protein Co-methyltransferase
MFSVIAQMARFYKIPSRGGGALTDAILIDNQSGYESMMVLMNTVLSGTNFILHSAGLLENYMTMSFEKFVCDDEMLGMVKAYMQGFQVNDETLAVDPLLSVGSGGNFIAHEHTFTHMKDTRLPMVSARVNYAGVKEMVDTPKRANDYYRDVIESYKAPKLDEKIENELDRYISNLS